MATGAPVESGVAIRYPSTALLCVDSADGEVFDRNGFRLDTTSPSTLYINRQRPLVFGYFTRLGLTELNVQWAIPNVNKTNNTLTFKVFRTDTNAYVGTYRAELLTGFYTMPELAENLAYAMNAAVAGLTNPPTFKVKISSQETENTTAETFTTMNPYFSIGLESPGPITYSFLLIPFNSPPNAENPFPPLIDDLTNMMGLTPTFSVAIQYGYVDIRGGYASMLYTPYFDIVSNILTKNQNVQDAGTGKFTTSSKLARIYLANEQIEPRVVSMTWSDPPGPFTSSSDTAIGCNGPFSFRREFKNPKMIQWNTTENVDVVDLQLLDYRGNPLPIDPSFAYDDNALIVENTADFQFTLQVSEV